MILRDKQKMNKSFWRVVAIAYVAFVALGLMDGLLGVAWPFIRVDFGMPVKALGVLILAGTSGHIVASFANGRLLQIAGIALLLTAAMALRGVGFFMQAATPWWWLLVAMGFVGGLGAGLLDAGMNTYAAARFRPRLLNWLHASFGVGTTLGSLLMTALLDRSLSWRVGLVLLAAVHFGLFVVFGLTRPYWTLPSEEEQTASSTPSPKVRSRDTLKVPMVWLSIAIFALYTGMELGMGQWSFTIAVESRQIAPTTAGLWTTLYWGSLTVGRIVFGFVETNTERLLRWVLVLVFAGAGLFALNVSPFVSLVGLTAVGFGLAPVFPMLIALTPKRIGSQHAPNAIGFQVGAAGIGAAVLPGLAGLLGDQFGLEVIALFFVGVAGLLFLLQETAVAKTEKSVKISAEF